MEKGNGQMKILSITMHWTYRLAIAASVASAHRYV